MKAAAGNWILSFHTSRFQSYSRILILLAALAYPLAFGHYRYDTTYGPPKLFNFIDGVILGAPFSVGLVLSATRLGRRHKIKTLGLILLSAITHFVFQIYTFPFLVFYMLLADCLGAYMVLTERVRR